MSSHPRLSLSVEAPSYASQRYPRTAGVSTIPRSTSRGSHTREIDDRRRRGVQGRADNSGGTPANRRVQTQLPHYFSSPATSASTSRSSAAASSSSSAASKHHNGLDKNQLTIPGGSERARSPKRRRTSPDASMLGKVPPATLKIPRMATQRAVQFGEENPSSSDLDEEEAWMQRARILTGRHEDVPIEASSSPRRPRGISAEASRPAYASVAPGIPQTLHSADATQAHARPRSPDRHAVAKEPSSPFQETPWLHDSLSELSMLPWEKDAALKLPQYRTSTGLKPTERDLQVKRDMEQAIAQKAQREAIARSLGQTAGKGTNAGTSRSGAAPVKSTVRTSARGWRTEQEAADAGAGASSPPRNENESALPHRKRPVTPMVTPQPASRRTPLSPRKIPNGSKKQPQSGLPEGERSGDGFQEKLGAVVTPSIRHPRTSTAALCPNDALPVTPTPELPAIRSPRSKRKVYALETQDGAPLPSPFDIRAAGIRRLPNRTPSGSFAAATPKVGEEAGGRSNLINGREDKAKQRSFRHDRDEAAATPRKLRDHLVSTNRLSPRSSSKKRARETRLRSSSSDVEVGGGGYAADSSSPLRSPGETQLLESDYDDEADETILPTGATGQSQQRMHVGQSARRESCEKEDEVMEETQPLPFPDAGDTSDDDEEEDLLVSRPPPNKSIRQMRRDGLQAQSSRHRTVHKPTGWASVNAAWEGLNLNDTAKAQTVGERQQHQPTLGRYGFDESTCAKRSAARPLKPSLPSAPEGSFYHPLSRDVTDHLTDDEDLGAAKDADDSGFVDNVRDKEEVRGLRGASKAARGTPTPRATSILAWSKEVVPDSQATQPLAWDDKDDSGKKSSKSPRSDTQETSNTEDEAVLPMDVLKRMRTKMTEWPQAGDDRERGIRGSSRAATNNPAAASAINEGGDSGDSDGWVPDMPSQMESFFGRL